MAVAVPSLQVCEDTVVKKRVAYNIIYYVCIGLTH